MQSVDTTSSLQVRPVTGVLGAEVSGIDLAEIDDSELRDLRAAICRHEVLVVRDQSVDVVQQSVFSRRLGPVGEVPF
jgi:taurine dioxygenase